MRWSSVKFVLAGAAAVLAVLIVGVWQASAQQADQQSGQSTTPTQSGQSGQSGQSSQQQTGQTPPRDQQQATQGPTHVRIIDGRTYVNGQPAEPNAAQNAQGQTPQQGQAVGGGPNEAPAGQAQPTQPNQASQPSKTAAQQCPDAAILIQRQNELQESEANLNTYSQALDRRAAALDAREDALNRRAAALDQQEAALTGQ